jgi:DNA-directed RNA polymerase subunit RPC12/RpoP
LRVNYKKGKRWCTNCGEQIEPVGLNCPQCGHRVRQSPRRSVYREVYKGLVGLYSAPKFGLKTSSAGS